MLPCRDCKHRGSIPGDAHICCKADWSGRIPPAFQGKGVQIQWYKFPYNFDPVWGPDECSMRNEGESRTFGALEHLLSFL